MEGIYVVDDDQGNQSEGDDMNIFDFRGMREDEEGKYWKR